LDGRLGEDSLDRVGKPGQPVDTRDQDVTDAAGLQLGEDLHPELRALGLLKPHAEHVAVAVERDPECEVQRAALDAAVMDDVRDWAKRPLEDIYPIVFLDCMVLKIREGGVGRPRALRSTRTSELPP
jgi:hypothetical protein